MSPVAKGVKKNKREGVPKGYTDSEREKRITTAYIYNGGGKKNRVHARL